MIDIEVPEVPKLEKIQKSEKKTSSSLPTKEEMLGQEPKKVC